MRCAQYKVHAQYSFAALAPHMPCMLLVMHILCYLYLDSLLTQRSRLKLLSQTRPCKPRQTKQTVGCSKQIDLRSLASRGTVNDRDRAKANDRDTTANKHALHCQSSLTRSREPLKMKFTILQGAATSYILYCEFHYCWLSGGGAF